MFGVPVFVHVVAAKLLRTFVRQALPLRSFQLASVCLYSARGDMPAAVLRRFAAGLLADVLFVLDLADVIIFDLWSGIRAGHVQIE